MPLHQTSGRWRVGLALSIFTVLLWGTVPIALAVAVQALDVYTVTWFRFVVSFVLLTVFLAIRQELPTVEKIRAAPIKLIAIAIIFFLFHYVLFLQGLAQTSPSNAEVLIQLAPVLMGLGALFIFKERYTLSQWIGLGLLTLGLTLFFHEQVIALINEPTNYLVGSSLLILSAIFWAIYSLALKQLLHTLPSSNILLIVYGGCGLLLTPLAKPQPILTLTDLQFAMLLFCGLNTVTGYGAFAESLDHLEASKVSAIVTLAPIVTLISMPLVAKIAPNLIKPEHITGLGILGALFVVAGSMIIALRSQNSTN
ncbi:MAG TPA: DMT family transporter [Oculatellaceae cyanobacterium]|jgi:drug/metabolite transporter (DMT)-like permease